LIDYTFSSKIKFVIIVSVDLLTIFENVKKRVSNKTKEKYKKLVTLTSSILLSHRRNTNVYRTEKTQFRNSRNEDYGWF